MEWSSGNGGGWTLSDAGAELGTLVVWDEAPARADRVRVAFGPDTQEEPIEHGVYLSAWWRVPCPEDTWPYPIRFRIAGQWVGSR